MSKFGHPFLVSFEIQHYFTRMKALVLQSADQFPVLTEMALASPQQDEVEIDVRAAALNRRDYWICKGKYPGIKYPIVLGF